MKRVLHILGTLQRGGAETMVMNLYRAIDKSQVQFDFLVKNHVENGYEDEVRELGGRIFTVPSAREIGVWNFILRQADVTKKEGPFIAVHSHVNEYSGLSMLAAKMSGIKCRISHSHNTVFQDKKKLFIGRTLISLFSTKLLACGHDAGVALFGKRNFIVIPNASDTEKFSPVDSKTRFELRKKLCGETDELLLCHVGRFNVQKNHAFIIQLAKQLYLMNIKYKIYLLGTGELFDEIQMKVKQEHLESNVVFCGSVKNVDEYYNACDMFILPSFHEGLPVTMVEAQCAGIKCLVSDRVTKEADLGVGLVSYIPLNVNCWIEKINEYAETCDACREKGQDKMLIEKKYNIKSSVQEMYKIYDINIS